MQDLMRMAMMQQGQKGTGQGMMPGMGMMPNLPAGMTQEKLEEMLKMRQMQQQQQMAMQMMQAGRPGAQQQGMPMGGLMQFMGK